MIGPRIQTVVWPRSVACGDSLMKSLDRAFHFLVFSHEPVGRPDAVEGPSEVLKLLLAEPVAVPCCVAGMIGCSITFDGQNKLARLSGMSGRQINAEFRAPPLRLKHKASC